MKCIVCEKEISKDGVIERHEVNFCSDACVLEYEKKLKDLEGVIDWDNCC